MDLLQIPIASSELEIILSNNFGLLILPLHTIMDKYETGELTWKNSWEFFHIHIYTAEFWQGKTNVTWIYSFAEPKIYEFDLTEVESRIAVTKT